MNTIGNAPFNVTRIATCVLFACANWGRAVKWDSYRVQENMLKFAMREMFREFTPRKP